MSKALRSLDHSFKQIDFSRKTLQESFESGNLLQRDISFAYEGLFLLAVRKFEWFLETYFFELATGEIDWKSRVIQGKRVRFRRTINETRREKIRLLLLGKQPFLKFLPYENCLDMANLIFANGTPFSLLDAGQKGHLIRCQAIRNLIAHASDSAEEKFTRQVAGAGTLPRFNRNPSGYLRSNFSARQTYFENEIVGLRTIAFSLI